MAFLWRWLLMLCHFLWWLMFCHSKLCIVIYSKHGRFVHNDLVYLWPCSRDRSLATWG